MHLPKHSNPRSVSNRTQIVSRSALQLEDEDAEADETTTLERKDIEDLHAELDKIVSKRLKLKRVLDPFDETSPSKRDKGTRVKGQGKPAGDHQEGLEPAGKSTSSSPPPPHLPDTNFQVFRLVSKWLPPRTIHLSPKPAAITP